MNTNYSIFLLITFMLFGCSTDLGKFIACYPDNKLESLNIALSIIDDAMRTKHPAATTEKSYELFANNYMNNPKEINDILTEDQFDLIKFELTKSSAIDDLTKLSAYNQRIRPYQNDYFSCLNELKTSGVHEYVESSEAGGRILYGTLIGNMTRLSELSKIEQYINKVEFMIRAIELKAT